MGRLIEQIEIKRATYRCTHASPGHLTFGVWINGGKSGELVVGLSEERAFHQMMERAGISYTKLTPEEEWRMGR